jgi:hypothetical protein
VTFQKRVEAIRAKFQDAVDELLDLMTEHPNSLQPIMTALNPNAYQPGMTHKNVWHTEAVLSDGHKLEDTVEMDHVFAMESQRIEHEDDEPVLRGSVLMILSLELEGA